jgi:NADH pyrophosphatase NudC (nudix superfamily)
MGFLTPEEARTCQSCGFSWFAERVGKPSKPAGYTSLGALAGDAAAAASGGAASAAKYQAKLQRYNRWRYCPRCGSKKVKSVSKRDFRPSDSQISAHRPTTTANIKGCGCGMRLSPAWRFCPMCATPINH